MTDGELRDQWLGLLFAVRRSVRYHSRRRNFFDGFRLSEASARVSSSRLAAATAV